MESNKHQSGFVNIFGAPNAGKSTLLNTILGEHLVITSRKVQTTRHRIMGILTEPNYQIVFSDTPGIMEPKYKLHEKMMSYVKNAVEDADVAILMHDITLPPEELTAITDALKLKVPTLLVLNKIDKLSSKNAIEEAVAPYKTLYPNAEIFPVAAKNATNTAAIVPAILKCLPEAPPFYPEGNLSDRPERFFVSELLREQIFELYEQEIPYHAAAVIQSFEEKPTLTVIKADIVVSQESQKIILIGKGGSKIKQLGINARLAMEKFLDKKVHLELFVKVRAKWRENDTYLREYGYH
jgi:GTPase